MHCLLYSYFLQNMCASSNKLSCPPFIYLFIFQNVCLFMTNVPRPNILQGIFIVLSHLINSLVWCKMFSFSSFFHLYIKKHTRIQQSFLYVVTIKNFVIVVLVHFRYLFFLLDIIHNLLFLSLIFLKHHNISMCVFFLSLICHSCNQVSFISL